MVDIDYRIVIIKKYLDKIEKQVEICNPGPLEQDLGSIPEQNLLYNYELAGSELNKLGKDINSKKPGIFSDKRSKENYNYQEKEYSELRSRHEVLGKDFTKKCTCTKSSR